MNDCMGLLTRMWWAHEQSDGENRNSVRSNCVLNCKLQATHTAHFVRLLLLLTL